MLKSIQIGNMKYTLDTNEYSTVEETDDFFVIEEQDGLTDDFYHTKLDYFIDRKKKYTFDRPKVINDITLYFTRACFGDCPYCHQGSNYHIMDSKGLTLDTVKNSLAEIEKIAPIADDLIFKCTGGDLFLCKEYLEIIIYLMKRFKNCTIKIFLSLLESESTYQTRVKDLLDILKGKRAIIELTFDLGVYADSYTRTAKLYDVDKATLYKRVMEIVNEYHKDIQVDVKSLLSAHTDFDLLKHELEEMFDMIGDKSVILFNLAKDHTYNPSNELIDQVIELFFDEYINYTFPIIGKKVGITRMNFTNNLKEQYCQSYLSSATIRENGTIGNCFVDYQQDKNWYSIKGSEDKKVFLSLHKDCQTCNLLFTCNRCVYRRRIYPCSVYSFFKEWEKFLLIVTVLCNYKDQITKGGRRHEENDSQKNLKV